MTEEEAIRLGNVVLFEVAKLSIPKIRMVGAAAGIDDSRIPAESERKGGSRKPRGSGPCSAQAVFGTVTGAKDLGILAERLGSSEDDDLTRLLRQHEYEFRNGAFLPIALVDDREAPYLPGTAITELSKALSRLAGDDESGAITAACGAVDGTTTALYEKYGLGSSSAASFQAKVNTALGRLGVFNKI